MILWRSFLFACSAVWRNIWLSFATTLVLFLALFLMSILGLLNIVADNALTVVQDKVDVTVYFVPDATQQEISEIQQRVEDRSNVVSATVVSKEEALDQFKERHEDNPLIQTALQELDNPLQASLVVKAVEPEDYTDITQFLQGDTFAGVIESVNLDDNRQIIERLTSITRSLSQFSIAVTVLFAVIATLIMLNAIRLAIYTQREEISVMTLVGATRTLIRLPLVLSAVIYGVVATALSTALLFPLTRFVGPRAQAFLGGVGSEGGEAIDIYSYFLDNVLLVVGAQLLFATFLAVVSSFFAIRRYLRKPTRG